MEDRRFIEEMFPVKEVSEESAREKSIRHGNISTLHIWWARKPHSSSRATIFGTLVPANVGQEILLKNERSFIIQLSNSSAVDDVRLIDLAKKKIIDG